MRNKTKLQIGLRNKFDGLPESRIKLVLTIMKGQGKFDTFLDKRQNLGFKKLSSYFLTNKGRESKIEGIPSPNQFYSFSGQIRIKNVLFLKIKENRGLSSKKPSMVICLSTPQHLRYVNSKNLPH
ncbi:hypothetical protein ACKWTF_003171 [Chironomus riparius]